MHSMRDLIALAEHAYLPLNKGAHDWARDLKGAFIVVMRPIDFLRLTTGGQKQIDTILGHDFSSIENYRDPNGRFNFTQYNMPHLGATYPDGQVHSHEGRHRAGMVLKAGGKSFPCAIKFTMPQRYLVTYYVSTPGVEDDIDHQEGPFDLTTAKALAADLENREFPDDGWAGRVRVKETTGGYTMREGPNGPWTAADMPDYLIGQFDPSVRVPTSTMRFGPIRKY